MESAAQASGFTQSATQTASVSKKRLWVGRIMSALVVLFLVFDAVLKFIKPAPVVEAFAHLGLPLGLAGGLGIVLLASTVLYAIPRTSVLGAILLTGYLGGAVASHLRVGDDLGRRKRVAARNERALAAKLPPGWASIGQMDWPRAIAFPGSPYSMPEWLSASMKLSSFGSACTGAENTAAAVMRQPAPANKRTVSG